MRYDQVKTLRQNDDPTWKRQAFVQSGAFATGAAVGVALGLVVAVTPVCLILGFVAAGAAAILADRGAQYVSWKDI